MQSNQKSSSQFKFSDFFQYILMNSKNFIKPTVQVQYINYSLIFICISHDNYQIDCNNNNILKTSPHLIRILLVKIFRMNNPTLWSSNIKKSHFQSLNKNIYCQNFNQLQYQKLFLIKSDIQRENALKRHFLQIKHIPHFKILENQKKYIKIQFKKYTSAYELSNFFSAISQAQKLKVIRQILNTYISLIQVYGFFCFDKNALKVDENGNFVLWIYTDFQKHEALKKYFFKAADTQTSNISRQKKAIHCFLNVFGLFLSHKKIKQNSQLTLKQIYQIFRQIQRKNQLMNKCPTFIKNKNKNKVLLQQVEECQKNDKNKLKTAPNNKKQIVIESLGNIEERSKSKSKIKKLLSYNKELIQSKHKNPNLQQKNSMENVSLKCRFSIKQGLEAIRQKSTVKKSKRTCSNIQNFFGSQNTFFLNKHQKQNKKTHRRMNTDIKSPSRFFRNFIPKQVTKLNQKHTANSQQKLNKIKPIQFLTNIKKKQNLKTQKIELNNPEIQINQAKRSMTQSSFTKQLTLKNYKYQESSQKISKVKSCSNLSTFFMKQLQNTTSTIPTLNNSKSNQHFFISSLNQFQYFKLQEELNEMFSSRTRNASIHIIDQQKYEQLKNQVDELLAIF